MSVAAPGRCGPAPGGGGGGGRTCFLWILLLVLVSVCVCDERGDISRKEIVAGGNLTLTCYAQPGQLRAYRWVYIRSGTRRPQVLTSGRRLVVGEPRLSLDTKTVAGQVALQLTLSDIKLYESGIFMCWRQGLRPDPQVLLTVLEPGASSEKQVISSLTGPEAVQYGEAALITCTITPPWAVKVTWLKNGAVIPTTAKLFKQNKETKIADDGSGEALVATLSIASVRRTKKFTCRIETDPPEEQTIEVAVRVPKVHSLTAEPDKNTVEYGQPLKLTCVVSGTSSEVLWLKDGSELTFGPEGSGREKFSGEQSPGTTASTVYIGSMSFADNGHYVCYIPGASKDILINIEGRPRRLLGITGGNFFEDEPLILRCSTQYVKNYQSSSVTWKFEGLPLDPSLYDSRLERDQYNVTVHEMAIPRAGSNHAGTYECVTPFGSSSIEVGLFVPPSLGEPLPSEVQVEEGQSLQVNCNAVGSPEPSVQWEKLVEDIWILAEDIDGVFTWPDGLIKIDTTRLDHGGNYRCAATSEAGSFLAEVFVHVERIPAEVVEMMAPEEVLEGENFTVLCTIANYMGPVDFWFAGQHLDPRFQPRYTVETYLRDDGLMQVYLTVPEATLEDSGLYECHAGTDAYLATAVEVNKRPGEVLEVIASPAVEGAEFFVSCTVKDWLKEVTFHHDGQVISRDNVRYHIYSPPPPEEEALPLTHILRVIEAVKEDSGVYRCFLDDFASATVTVEVEEPKEEVLSISASPAIIGHDFNITCRIRNWDEEVTFIHNNVVIDPEREWRYEVSKLPQEEDGSQTHILTVTTAAADDAGNYECFTSPLSSGAVAVEIWREAAVTLEMQTLDRPNWRDSPVPINCIVEGVDPDKVTVLFSHEETPQVAIQNKTKMSTSSHLVNIAITEEEDTTTPLTTFTIGFYTIGPDLTGFWSCEVLHPGGSSLGKDVLYIEVADIPAFAVKPPEEVYEDLEADLYLNCSSSGPQETIVAWFRKGISQPIISQQQSATLFIPGFTSTDEGEYFCLALLNDREIKAETVLRLRTPQPRVVSVAATKSAEGEDLEVTCTVAYWNDEVLFFLNGEPADPELSPRFAIHRQPGSEDETLSHVLTIHGARLEDAGVAECFISLEEFGSTVIEVEGAPDLPSKEEEEPSLPPGRIVDLQGPILVEEGATLTLTCLVSPVVPQTVVLYRDSFVLFVGDKKTMDDDRLSLSTGAGGDGTRYVYLNLEQVTQNDGGEYGCDTSTAPPASATWIVNVVPPGTLAESTTTTPAPTTTLVTTTDSSEEYEDLLPAVNGTLDTGGCTFPAEWIGEWNVAGGSETVNITVNTFFKGSCVSALPERDAYLVKFPRKKKDCVRCFIMKEKHSNFLEYKKSKCHTRRDPADLCASAEETDASAIIREGSATRCPFRGSRSFSYQKPVGACDLEPSKLSSIDNDTVLYFIYNPCSRETSRNAFGYPEKVGCIASWKENGTHYLVGKLLSFTHGAPEYRCYIYEEKAGQAFRYSMTRTNSHCGAYSYDYEYFYRINDESIAPGPPEIEGFDVTTEVKVGFPVRLTCRSRGGFPPAKLTWHKNGLELHSDSLEVESESVSHLDLIVQEDDAWAEYSCEASNFAAALTATFNFSGLMPTTEAPMIEPTTMFTTTTTTEQPLPPTTTPSDYYDYDMEFPRFRNLTQSLYEVDEGETLVITCGADGFPDPFVQWRKRDSEGTNRNVTEMESGEAILVLSNVTESANYTCQAESAVGVISKEVHVRVSPAVPDTKLALRVDDIGDTYVGLEWDDHGREAIYTLEYNKLNATDSTNTTTITVKGGNKFLILELDPFTVYEFRIALMKDDGSKLHSNSVFAITENAVSTAVPDTKVALRVNQIGEAYVDLEWDDYGGDATYTLEYNKRSEPNETTSTSVVGNKFLILELEPFTEYEFRIALMKDDGSKQYSDSVFAITGDTAPARPKIEGFDPSETRIAGASIQLVCLSGGGGLSNLSLRWFKNGEEVVEEVVPWANGTQIHLEVVLEQEDDGAEFMCEAVNDVGAASTSVVLQVDAGVCHVPERWAGDWYSGWEQVLVSSTSWLDQECLKSSKNRFLVKKEWRECNTCYLVKEKHHNILEYQESRCEATNDLKALCGTIDEDQEVTRVVRLDSVTRCPFTGSRSFTYDQRHGSCNDSPSRLTSQDNDTVLVFQYDPCPDDNSLHVAIRTEKIECVATWSENATHFMMGKLESLLGGEPRYRCFTYSEEPEADYEYFVGRTSSRTCGALGDEFDNKYRVYRESVEPGPPTIAGHSADTKLEIGSSLNLTCSGFSGFPPAKMKWFRDGVEIDSETQIDSENSTSVFRVTVEEEDEGAEFLCKAYNLVGDYNTSVVISLVEVAIPVYENIMLPTVVTVEDETAFLPCIRTQQDNLKVEWFDADLETQLTSGDEILSEDKSNLQPWSFNGTTGLVVQAGFVDTNYACNVNGRRVGNTTVVILSRYLIGEEEEDSSSPFQETETQKTVSEGDAVTLNCSVVSSESSALVRWRRQPGSLLLAQDDLSLAESEGYAVDVSGYSSLLRVDKADIRHAGSYSCQVILDEEVHTKNFSVEVEEVITTYLGHEGSISCYSPMGQDVKYIHEGNTIQYSDILDESKYTITKSKERSSGLAGRGGAVFTLTVYNASLEDEGIYECISMYEDPLRVAVLEVDLEEFIPVPTETATTTPGPLPTTTTEMVETTTDLMENTTEVITTMMSSIDTTTESSGDGEPLATFPPIVEVTSDDNETDFRSTDIFTTEPTEVTTSTTEMLPTVKTDIYEVDSDIYEEEPDIVEEEPDIVEEEPDIDEEEPDIVEEAPDIDEDEPEIPEEEPEIHEEESEIPEEEPEIPEEEPEIPEEKSEIPEEEPDIVEEEPEIDDDEPEIYEEEPDIYIIDYEDYSEEPPTSSPVVTEPPPPMYPEVLLECEGSEHRKLEDIVWKHDEDLLFLGQLNLAAVPGFSLTSEGALVLVAGPEEDIRNDDTYTCYGFDMNTFEDITLVTYHVSLSGEDTIVEKISEGRTDKQVIRKPKPKPKPQPASTELKFDGLAEEELVVLGNTRRVGRRIEEVLKSGGISVRLIEDMLCRSPNKTRSWADAQDALEECESSARAAGLLGDKSVFIGIDFYVELSPSSWFALTKLYLHNIRRNEAVSVFAPMVPVPAGKVRVSGPGREPRIQASESWWDSVQGARNTFGNALAASILSLEKLLKESGAERQ